MSIHVDCCKDSQGSGISLLPLDGDAKQNVAVVCLRNCMHLFVYLDVEVICIIEVPVSAWKARQPSAMDPQPLYTFSDWPQPLVYDIVGQI